MKKMKKVLAILLAMAMVLGMSMTTLAAPDGSKMPTESDSAEIVVNGVKPGATVKAFQIAEGKWKEGFGFTKYNAIEFTASDGTKVKVKDLANPTAEEVTAISNIVDRQNGGTVLDEVERNGVECYTKTLNVGIYLILVTENADKDMTAYNPMIASVYYSVEGSGDNNVAIGGSVSAEDNFEVNGQAVFAKSMNPDITKEIVSPLETTDNKYGNDTAIGDEIKFKVETSFPSYSDAYTAVEFNIVDTLSKGLSFTSTNPVTSIKVGDSPAVEGKYTTTVNDKVMTISFDSVYILENRGKTVVVEYTAALNSEAGFNFDKNTNTVKAEYTNNPTTNEKGETEEKRTYHYTFGIDASINGSWDEITKELLKTGEEYVTGSTTEKAPLDGATFTLTKKDDPTKVYTTISGKGEVGKDINENGEKLPGAKDIPSGYLKFTGLDAGEYVLQETKAPDGYSLNAVEIPVKIEATYNNDGTLSSYKITVDGSVVEENGTVKDSQYTATYEKDTNGAVTDTTLGGDSVTQEIPNTKLSALPSTGGIGTTIFTVGGCAIMIIAAGLYFASRRKAAK